MHWWILDVALVAFGIVVLALAGLSAYGRVKRLKSELATVNERVAGLQAQVAALPLPSTS